MGANLRGANLREANLGGANLGGADLGGADLGGADLRGADLVEANLTEANLTEANLRGADLVGANLTEANLTEANLTEANLVGANLSGAKGLLNPLKWFEQFARDRDGIIVFKGIGNTPYATPEHWNISPNSFLEEVVNPDRATECGCGVNFGTEEWVQATYPKATLWKCRIHWEDLVSVVVPFNTDGKAITQRAQSERFLLLPLWAVLRIAYY
jgi:hypothetical protein